MRRPLLTQPVWIYKGRKPRRAGGRVLNPLPRHQHRFSHGMVIHFQHLKLARRKRYFKNVKDEKARCKYIWIAAGK